MSFQSSELLPKELVPADQADSFYGLLEEFLSGNNRESSLNPEIVPDLDFWGTEPPVALILATGSVSKSFILSSRLNGLKNPMKPAETHQHYTQHVNNGDGVLQQKVFLGYFYGVPFYAESAAPGETAGNDPVRESRNKADWLARKYGPDEGDYLIITTDAVDFVDSNGNGRLDGEEGLGKPQNNPDFPKREVVGEEEYQRALEKFIREFIKENFIEGAQLIHSNGVVVFEILRGLEDPQEVRVWEVLLQSTIGSSFFENYRLSPSHGGGGATQQNINWDSPEEILSALDQETQELILSLYENDPDDFKAAVFEQIYGMPWVNILHEIKNWAIQRKSDSEID